MVKTGAIITGIILLIIVIVFVAGITTQGEKFTPPESTQKTVMPGVLTGVLTSLGFPAEWLYMPAFLYYAIIPLAGVWLILYGFLDQLMIFKEEWINGALSFMIAFSTIPLGAFVSTVAVVFGVLGVYSTVAFVVLAVTGIWFMSSTLFGGWRAGALEGRLFNEQERAIINEKRGEQKKIKELEKQMEEWKKKAESGEVSFEAARKAIKKLGTMTREQRQKIKELEIKEKELEKLKKLQKSKPYYGNVY